MDKQQRDALNQARVAKMDVLMRPNILAIIADLEGAGWQPVIDSGVYRTPAEQAQKVAQGVSTVSYSYHNVTSRNGIPESEAADIVDIRYGWNPPATYWLQLAGAAENQGLETGIYWGLTQAQRNTIHTLIGNKSWGKPYSRGWDAAHVQPPQSKFTTSEARYGYRYNPRPVRPPILSNTINTASTVYKLLGSDGHEMDTLQAIEGTAFVSARKWGAWMGIDIGYQDSKVLIGGGAVTTKLIDGVGYVPVREAAARLGLSLVVDEKQRTIMVMRG